MAVLTPVPYHGSKTSIAEQIVSRFPAHEHYVDLYAGSLSVLLAKPRSAMETANDLAGDLTTFWKVLRDRREDLQRMCALTPHSRAEFTAATQSTTDELETARRVWVRLTQGRSGQLRGSGWNYEVAMNRKAAMGRMLQTRLGRIPAAAERLVGVTLEALPAVELVRRYGHHPGVLFYADPPYVGQTRNSGGNYLHEMSTDDHRAVADELRACAAAVVVSGYPSELYDIELYPGWHRVEISARTAQGGQVKATTEVLWSNRPFVAHDLFDLEGGTNGA